MSCRDNIIVKENPYKDIIDTDLDNLCGEDLDRIEKAESVNILVEWIMRDLKRQNEEAIQDNYLTVGICCEETLFTYQLIDGLRCFSEKPSKELQSKDFYKRPDLKTEDIRTTYQYLGLIYDLYKELDENFEFKGEIKKVFDNIYTNAIFFNTYSKKNSTRDGMLVAIKTFADCLYMDMDRTVYNKSLYAITTCSFLYERELLADENCISEEQA